MSTPPTVTRIDLITRYRFQYYLGFDFPTKDKPHVVVNYDGQEIVTWVGENKYKIWKTAIHGNPPSYQQFNGVI